MAEATFTTIADIKSAVNKFNNDTVFIKLKVRWQNDFNLWRQKPYDAGKGYYSYTSNSPKLLANKSISMCNGSHLMLRIPLDLLLEEDRETASDVERFWYGSLNMVDKRLADQGLPTLRKQMSWYSNIRGSYFVRVLMNKDDDGNTVPEVDVWDSYNVAYGEGKDGLIWVAHSYKATKAQIKDTYNIDVAADEVTVIEYCDGKNVGVIVGGRWGNELQPHGLDYTPVFHQRVGSMPRVQQTNYSYTEVHRGESIFEQTRLLFPMLDKTVSDLLTLVRRGVKVPLGYWTADGSKNLDQDIYQVEKAAVIPMAEGEKIEPLIQPTMPADTQPLLQILSGEVQRGGFPHSTFGVLGFRLSGFAINQLLAGIETTVAPFLEAEEESYLKICNWLLAQYTKGGFNPIRVRGRTSRDEAFGYPKAQTIRASNLKGDWTPEVRLEPVMPRDDAQRYQLAQLARQPDAYGQPLLSRRTVHDRLLEVRDPDYEEEVIDSEYAGAVPLIKLQRMLDAAIAQQNFVEAHYIALEIQRLLFQMGGQQRAGQAGQQPLPQEETAGLPPEVAPPGAEGEMPGGAAGAKMPLEGEL